MADFGTLTMVGLIATVLSIGFALAAFINSRRREADKREKPDEAPPGIPFLASDGQTPEKTTSTHAAPFYATASRHVVNQERTKPAFKQVQALGAQSVQNDSFNSDEYLWE